MFEGEQLYLYEEITNDKLLPIPYAKIETELPEGLSFILLDEDVPDPGKAVSYGKNGFLTGSIQSIFALRGKQKIRRRFMLYAAKRGVYNPGKAVMVASDIVCLNKRSKAFVSPASKSSTLTVLPRAVDLSRFSPHTDISGGDAAREFSLTTDPLTFSGIRDYTVYDPMKLINWKVSAVQRKLMVNVETHSVSEKTCVLLNINSRESERDPDNPVSPADVEKCITVCASLFDRASVLGVPVRLISNASESMEGYKTVKTDEDAMANTLVTPFMKTTTDYIMILRLLASLRIRMTYSVEKLLALMARDPFAFTENGSVVVVTSFVSEDMISFHEAMKRRGIGTCFLVTTTNNNAFGIPADMDVRYENINRR